jgi:phosphoadenosine phosphosulfate reductase
MSHHSNLAEVLQSGTDTAVLVQNLRRLAEQYAEQVVFSTSFGLEDQVITHLIFDNDLPIRVFTLDTGRMFPETYSVWSSTLERYGKPIQAWYPDAQELQAFVQEKGPNAFYESVENRKSCCHIRKVAPLNKALKDQKIWITGIRADQSANRLGMSDTEWDEAHQLHKYHPLFHWTFEQTKDFVKAHNIPYNALHDKGFVSIGCAPCTRAIRPGEDFRAGRWWWEDTSKKECGLHA